MSGETLDEIRDEMAKLRASRERLVLAADAERRAIERELHEGVQQHLVALSVGVQRAGALADADPAALKALLEELGRGVQEALDAASQLAHRIYPPLLDEGGLGVALRSAAASAGIPVRVEVEAGSGLPADAASALYFCYLELLEQGAVGEDIAVKVAHDGGAVSFEIGPLRSEPELQRVRDRVEALGGTLTNRSAPGGAGWVAGSVPLRE